MSFFDKENYTIEDIEKLMDTNEEESLTLEFKSSGSLFNHPDKKREMAKDISAFANSAGGIIVYGIMETDHKADSLSFIDGNQYTKEWIEQVINTNIQRRIGGIEIHPIRRNGNIEESIYVIKVPQSNNAPHMTTEKKYYKRHNFEVLPMEEHEIRWAYNQKARTELEILDFTYVGGAAKRNQQGIYTLDYTLSFYIKNTGLIVETLFKVELHIPNQIYMGSNNSYNLVHPGYPQRSEGNTVIFSIQPNYSLFQEERIPVCTLNITIAPHTKNVYENEPVKLKLYYTNGIKEREFHLADEIHYLGASVRSLKLIYI